MIGLVNWPCIYMLEVKKKVFNFDVGCGDVELNKLELEYTTMYFCLNVVVCIM